MKITVVAPHRGDAAFSLGLSIEAWLGKGHAVEVLNCFTRSEFAPYSDAGSVHANDRASFVSAVRKREDEAWRKRFGAAKLTLTDLNLKDAPLRLHCGADEVFGRAADASEKIVAKFRIALEKSRAGAVVLPLGLGGHVDHVTVRDVALSLIPMGGPLAFYEELPETASAGADEAIKAEVLVLTLAVQSTLQPVFAEDAGTDDAAVEAAVAREQRMAWCYDSQIDETATAEIAMFCRRYGGRERMWGNEAWRGDTALR
ncbi:MAG: PIG-L family deacetylase [Acidobacteriaceae bacterium]